MLRRMTLSRAPTLLLTVIAVAAGIWLLQVTYVVTMPLTAAVFVAAVVWPVYRRVSLAWHGRVAWLAMPVSMAIVLLVLATAAAALVAAVMYASDRFPRYAAVMRERFETGVQWAQARGIPVEGLAGGAAESPGWVASWLTYGLSSLWSLVGLLVLMFFFTALLLVEARRWRDKTNAALEDDGARKVLDTARTVAVRVRRYLVTQSTIGLISAVAQTTFLWLMGVELALVWGLLFLILNYIPNIGSLIAMIPPLVVALVMGGPTRAAAVLAGMSVIETLMGYFVAPWWQGRNLTISPVILLLSVTFWGWLWGPVGAVLAVPLTATIMIGAWHVRVLRPLALFLSGTDDETELRKQATTPPAAG